MKCNPDFTKDYFKYYVCQEEQDTESEEDYEPLLRMNDVTIRTAFPTALSGQTTASLPLTQLVHIVDYGPLDCILNDGSSIPRLVTEGEVARIPPRLPRLTGNRCLSTAKPPPIPWLLTTNARRSYVRFRPRKYPEAKTRL